MARLIEEIRALSSSYEERKSAALLQKKQDDARKASEWELQTVRDAREQIFPEIVENIRSRATSGLTEFKHQLPSSPTEVNRYNDLAVPVLTRLLTEEGFQVSFSTEKEASSGAVKLSAPMYNHYLRIQW